MSEESKNTESQISKRDDKTWLDRIAQESWEPELIISGIAIYALFQLPALLDQLLDYYQFNIQVGTNFVDEALPLLAIIMLKTGVYVLTVGFVLHFLVRAFWVAFIGLNSVYETGIKFESLSYNDTYKKLLREKMGSPKEFALSLDKTAGILLSLSFLIVLVLAGVSFVYTVFFLLFNASKLILPADWISGYEQILYYVFTGLFLVIMIAFYVSNMKRFRGNEKVGRFQFKLAWFLTSCIYPIVTRSVQHISLTFQSNVSKAKMVIGGLIIATILTFTFFTLVVLELNPNYYDSRELLFSRSSELVSRSADYETNITEQTHIEEAVLSTQQVTDGLLSIFIPYPKMLDTKLAMFCSEALAEVDSMKAQADEEGALSKYQRRDRANQIKLECINRYFSYAITSVTPLGDTLKPASNLVYANHGKTGQYGFIDHIVLPDTLPAGRYKWLLKVPVVDDEDKERTKKNRMLRYQDRKVFWLLPRRN